MLIRSGFASDQPLSDSESTKQVSGDPQSTQRASSPHPTVGQTLPPDTVSLTSEGLSPAQLRALKVEQLREAVQTGNYHLPASALAQAMRDRLTAQAGDPSASTLDRIQ